MKLTQNPEPTVLQNVRRLLFPLLVSVATTSVVAQPTWKPFVTSIGGRPPIGAAFLNERYGFVTTTGNRSYRTTDGGASWTRIAAPDAFIGMGPVYFYSPGNIFLHGTYESTDSGLTWKTLPQTTRWTDQPFYAKDGIFFDCQGRVSADHARSWGPQHFPNGECVTGNLDKSIAVWGGSSTNGSIPTSYSTDGGITWNPGQNGVEADFGYAFPFTLTYIRAGGDGIFGQPTASAIQRSTDGGATWTTVYGSNLDSLGLDDGLCGDACVVYTQTKYNSSPSGLLRSTDRGVSWSVIGGPSAGITGRDDQPLCGATTRGTVCYAIDTRNGSDTVWKFTDRSIYTPVLNDTRIFPNFADTLVISECDSALLQIQTEFASCDFIRIQDLRIENFGGGSSLVTVVANKIIHSGAPDTSYALIRPSLPGTYNVLVHLHYCQTDWTGVDTTFPLVIVVKPNPPTLVIDTSSAVSFGLQTLCLSGGSDTLNLSSKGCRPVVIYRTWIDADSATSLEFSVTKIINDSVYQSDLPRAVVVDFHPSSPGRKPATLVIETSQGTVRIPIHASVLPDSHALVSSIDTLSAPMCLFKDGMLRFVNPTCRRISVDSMTLADPFSLLPNQLPLSLAPGDTALIAVRFIPSTHGTVTVSAPIHLRFFEPTFDLPFDTTITMTAIGLRGMAADSLSAFSVVFDSLHLCESEVRTVTLYSVGCDSLLVNSISVTGDPDFALVGSPTQILGPGDSLVLNISLDPTTIGDKTARLVVTLDSGRRITIPLLTTTRRAIRRLTLDSVGMLNFGSCWVCEQPHAEITLRNPGCDSVTISDGQWIGGSFRIADSLPIVIPPGGVVKLHLIGEPDTTGAPASNTARLTLVTNSDSTISSVPCSLSIKYPKVVHMWFESQPLPMSAGNMWVAKIKTIPGELDSISTIDLRLDYNSDLLGYWSYTSPDSLAFADEHSLHIEGKPTLLLAEDSSIATLTFEVYLTTDTVTTVMMNRVRFNGDDSIYTGCHAVAFAGDVTFEYQNECGHPTIRNFLRGLPPILRIVPNPSNGNVYVRSDTPLESLQARIVNVLGQVVYSRELEMDSPTSYRLPESVSIPPGSYAVEFSTKAGFLTRSRLVVRR